MHPNTVFASIDRHLNLMRDSDRAVKVQYFGDQRHKYEPTSRATICILLPSIGCRTSRTLSFTYLQPMTNICLMIRVLVLPPLMWPPTGANTKPCLPPEVYASYQYSHLGFSCRQHRTWVNTSVSQIYVATIDDELFPSSLALVVLV